jgi:hypothetical protein
MATYRSSAMRDTINSTFEYERNLVYPVKTGERPRVGHEPMGQSQPFPESSPPTVAEERPHCPKCQMRMITVLNPETSPLWMLAVFSFGTEAAN